METSDHWRMRTGNNSEQNFPFTKLDGIRSALNAFFKFAETKILMVKGPWGVGKSFFLREYIRSNTPTSCRGSILPDWIAYVSLFGCSSVQQLEERIAASILPSKSWGNPTSSTFAQVFHSVVSNTRFSFLGVSFALPVHSLIWRLTKQKGILLVLDDLERTDENLKLPEVLGFVSSLSENSTDGVKIIVVCNTGRLDENAADKLASLREKVLHTELLFNPSPDELVEEYFHHPELKSTVAWCLRIIAESNIRIIARTSKAVTTITQLFADKKIQLSKEDKVTIVKLCVFFYRVGRTLPISWYRGSFMDRIFSGKESQADKDPARELFRKLEADWDEIGPAVIDWLSHGLVSDEILQAAVVSLQSKIWRESYRAKSSNAYRVWTSNFLITDVQLTTQPVADLVSEYCEVLPLEDLNRHLQFLNQFEVDTTNYLLRHVTAWLPRMDRELCDTYMGFLTNKLARRLVEERRDSLIAPRSPKEIIWNAIKNQNYSPEDMRYVASLDVATIVNWLRNESDPDTLIILREFMTWFKSHQDTKTSRACQLISDAVRQLAEETTTNRLRATTYHLLLPDVPRPELSEERPESVVG